tara:strand:+ start:605 stop:1015 length:411 start_codon:yes stop_codon:yes gene_type:complete
MNFLKNQQSKDLSIEITPLIDIVFLLVIFFVVTSKIDNSQFLNIDLPTTTSFSNELILEDSTIYLFENGSLKFNDINLTIDDLQPLIAYLDTNIPKMKTIILAIEKKAYHEWVLKLMDELQIVGFKDIQIRTYQES